MKLYYAHNEYFADIYQGFKSSIKDPWEIMEYKIDDFKEINVLAGGREGDAMRNNLLKEAFKTTNENEIFVMSDIDILFYRPCIKMIKQEFEKKQLVEINGKTIEKEIDLIFQKENCNPMWNVSHGQVNMGFMAIKNNEKNKYLFDRVYAEVFEKKLWDQPTLNKFLYQNMKHGVMRIPSSPKDLNNVAHYLNNEDAVWDTFCPEVWNYSIGLNYLNENIYLHHANCAVTKEQKFNQFEKVKKLITIKRDGG